jgi:hypothetical protein
MSHCHFASFREALEWTASLQLLNANPLYLWSPWEVSTHKTKHQLEFTQRSPAPFSNTRKMAKKLVVLPVVVDVVWFSIVRSWFMSSCSVEAQLSLSLASQFLIAEIIFGRDS